MRDSTLKTQLQAYMDKLVAPIEISAAADEHNQTDKSREMLALLDDIASLSPKISLGRDDSIDARKPSFAITRAGEQMGIRFAGIPMGHEFTSLILALLQAGGHPPKVDTDVIEYVSAKLSGLPISSKPSFR